MNLGSIEASLKEAVKHNYGNVSKFDNWIVKKNVKTYNCLCGYFSIKKSNLDRHLQLMRTKMQEQIHITGPGLSCVISVCGRTIPTMYSENMEKKD